MNHETLEQHLAAKRWKEADELTRSTILARVDRWYYEWSQDSFVGYELLEKLYDRFEKWRALLP